MVFLNKDLNFLSKQSRGLNKLQLTTHFMLLAFLHNMNLIHNGLNTLHNEEINWRTLDPVAEDIDDDIELVT